MLEQPIPDEVFAEFIESCKSISTDFSLTEGDHTGLKLKYDRLSQSALSAWMNAFIGLTKAGTSIDAKFERRGWSLIPDKLVDGFTVDDSILSAVEPDMGVIYSLLIDIFYSNEPVTLSHAFLNCSFVLNVKHKGLSWMVLKYDLYRLLTEIIIPSGLTHRKDVNSLLMPMWS